MNGNGMCSHVLLHGPDLTAAFAGLMLDKGVLPVEPSMTSHDESIVNADIIDPEIARIVRCAYPLDMCLLGFASRSGRSETIFSDTHMDDTGCRI